MKHSKIITALCAAAAFFVSANAQETDFRSRTTVGLKAGLNISNVYDVETDDFEADAKVGFAGGGFITVPVGRLLAIQPEILYSQKGFSASGSFFGSNYNITRTLNYLDIPIFISVRPSKFLSIMAGPQFSYLMSRNDRFTNNSFTSVTEQNFANDDIRRNTVCFVGGFDINSNRIVIGGRIGWDLFNNLGNGDSNYPRYKNVWGQATLGFRL